MATTKISALTELTTPASADVLVINDDSAGATKKIQVSNIAQENFTTTLKTKVDGIETGATADQTGAEIKAAYEAEANAYTDTKDTKLAGIEASADVTDAINVATAGAVMDGDFSSNGLLTRTGAGVYSTTTDSSANWDTAYGWGDHSAGGYSSSGHNHDTDYEALGTAAAMALALGG